MFKVAFALTFVKVQFDGAKLPTKPIAAAEVVPFNKTLVPGQTTAGAFPALTTGTGFTTTVIVAVVAHCPAVGVKV